MCAFKNPNQKPGIHAPYCVRSLISRQHTFPVLASIGLANCFKR